MLQYLPKEPHVNTLKIGILQIRFAVLDREMCLSQLKKINQPNLQIQSEFEIFAYK